MANIIKIKRSTTTATPTGLSEGELAYSENSNNLFIGTSGSNVTVIGGSEGIADVVGSMVTGNTESGISVTYQDSDNTLDFALTADPTITLGGDLTGSATLTDLGNATLTATIGTNAVQKAMVHTDVITGQTELAANPDGDSDYVLIYDASASGYKKIAAKYLGSNSLSELDNVGTDTATSGNMMLADGDSWESVGMSGDITMTSAGVTTIGAGKVLAAELGVTAGAAAASKALVTDANKDIDMGTGDVTAAKIVATAGVMEVKNTGSDDAAIRLYCGSNNAHYAHLESAPHSAYSGNATVTLPALTSTLATKALTETFTNKTLSGGILTGTTTVADGTNDFDVASHDGSNGLKLGGTLVTSSAAELNLLDGITAGTAAAGKALIADANKDINLGSGDITATNITGSIQTASQANITSVGTLTGLTVGGNATIADGTNDFDVASHDGTNGLKLGGTLVTSSAADLNLLDGVTAGTASASKALVVDSSKDLNLGSGDLTATNLTGSVQTASQTNITSVGTLDGLAVSASQTVSMGANRVTNVADPSQAQDAATKAYVDAVKTGLDVKDSVRVATTASGTLASAFDNASTVDGVTLATGDRILLKDQSTGSENGIYTVNASGAPTRAVDMDSTIEATGGLFTFVEEGTTNSDASFVMTNNGTVTLGSTSLTFAQFSGAGQITAGTGISKTGNTINIGSGTGITVNADSIEIDTTWAGQAAITTVGTVSSGTWAGNTVGVGYGGTGISSFSAGDLMYASGATAVSKLGAGTAGQMLIMNSGATAPEWTNTLDGGTF